MANYLVWSWLGLKIWLDKKTIGLVRKYRAEYWRRQLIDLGEGSQFYGKVVILNPQQVKIGAFCTLNEGVILIAKKEKIIVGDYVRISARALISATGLGTDNAKLPYHHISKPVIIEDGVWIGSGAQIMPGVRLGTQCVVAAGAVVTKDVEPFSSVKGVPAR